MRALLEMYPYLTEALYVFLTGVLLYIVLRACLGLITLLFKKLSHEWQTIIDEVRWPVYWLIIVFLFWLFVTLPFFPTELKTDSLINLVRLATTIGLLWLGVRAFTMTVFSLYFYKIRGISIPQILPWIVNKLLYVAAFIGFMHVVYEFNIGDLIVTMAILFIVLSVAFQNPLGNFIADVSASFQKTFTYGDLIQMGDFQGKVVESNWRNLRLLNSDGNHVTIPIRQTSELPIINFSRPDPSQRLDLEILVNGSFPPNRVQDILLRSARETDDALKDPPPVVSQRNSQNGYVRYTVAFFIKDYRDRNKIADTVRSIAWYKLCREGPSSLLASVVASETRAETKAVAERHAYIADIIGKMDFFSALSEDEVKKLAKLARLEIYGQRERLFNQGDQGNSLYIVCSGSIGIRIKQPSADTVAEEKEVTTLAPGSVIGEISLLTGEPRSASAVVNEESDLIVVDKPAFQQILVNNPPIVESLTDTMLERQARDAKRATQMAKEEMAQQRSKLVSKIKSFFQL